MKRLLLPILEPSRIGKRFQNFGLVSKNIFGHAHIFFFFYILVHLFIWLCWVLVMSCRIFSMWGTNSLIVARRLSSYGIMTLSCTEAHGILVPLPGIKPTSPVLQGIFSTTGQPGKFLCMPIF